MKLSLFHFNSINSSFLWLWITILIWWSGLAGRDIFVVPALIFVGLHTFKIFKNQPSISTINWTNDFLTKRFLIILFLVHVVLNLATTILKYYSFSWNVWDVGSHSNMLYNISKGIFYSSYLGTHNWGDHFSPSMSPLALFYLFLPSTHWVTVAKTVAYLTVPLLIQKICKETFQSKEQAWNVTVIIGVSWMLFYAPALNSLYFEFQPSALAPPFILYAFLCFQRKFWLRFWVTMIFILGFKEHLGAVWIGFGCFMVLVTPNKKMGFFLISGGIISIYLIMFHIMPYFRNYEESWSMPFGPFVDIPGKLIYLFKILMPLGFLPLIFWRFGIIAGPAIGVNMLSSNPKMYSTGYHYDDISSTLLMLAIVLIVSSGNLKLNLLEGKKSLQLLLLGWIICIFGMLPHSPMRELYASIPNTLHRDIRKELIEFDQFSKGESIAVQTSLGPQLNRTNILAIAQDRRGECTEIRRDPLIAETKYLVFSKYLNHYLIKDLDQCLEKFNLSKDYEILHEYKNLYIYKKIN